MLLADEPGQDTDLPEVPDTETVKEAANETEWTQHKEGGGRPWVICNPDDRQHVSFIFAGT